MTILQFSGKWHDRDETETGETMNTDTYFDSDDCTNWKPVTIDGFLGWECIETGEIRTRVFGDLTREMMETFWEDIDASETEPKCPVCGGEVTRPYSYFCSEKCETEQGETMNTETETPYWCIEHGFMFDTPCHCDKYTGESKTETETETETGETMETVYREIFDKELCSECLGYVKYALSNRDETQTENTETVYREMIQHELCSECVGYVSHALRNRERNETGEMMETETKTETGGTPLFYLVLGTYDDFSDVGVSPIGTASTESDALKIARGDRDSDNGIVRLSVPVGFFNMYDLLNGETRVRQGQIVIVGVTQ